MDTIYDAGKRGVSPQPPTISRRAFHQYVGAGLLAFTIAGSKVWLSPGEAYARGLAYRTLTPGDVAMLERLSDALVPGAAKAGLAHYLDYHLSVAPGHTLLMIRYLPVAPPFVDFYRAGLTALDAASHAAHGRVFLALDAAEAGALLHAAIAGTAEGWAGPPAGLFMFVVRSDAIDVSYGTEAGFAALGIPYLAHIAPPHPWQHKGDG